MKVFFLWHYYRAYVRHFHARYPEFEALPFAEHRTRLFADHYAWPADLSLHMRSMGCDTEFVVANDERLQKKWATEQGVTFSSQGWEREIVLEQIRRYRPDVVWLGSHFEYYGSFVREILRHSGKVVAWVGEPWPAPPDLGGISALITENPDTFREAQARFERVIVTHPGFSPDVLKALEPAPKRDIIVFVGQFTRVHRLRSRLVAHLLRRGLPLVVHGMVDGDPRPGWFAGTRLAAWSLLKRRNRRQCLETLRRTFRTTADERAADLVRSVCREPVFGMEMYRALAGARVVLNVHGDIAGRHAGNMRMFEATGVGACLVTEHADNIETLFEPGREVLTYRDMDDLADVLERGMLHPEELDRIGRAGQARTLKCHTLDAMFQAIRDVFDS